MSAIIIHRITVLYISWIIENIHSRFRVLFLDLCLAKSLIVSLMLILCNKSASIISRDKESDISCLIVVRFGFLYVSIEEMSVLLNSS